MTYRINIAEKKGRTLQHWDNTDFNYGHYFKIETDRHETMLKIVEDLMQIYPHPAYNITVSKSTTTSTEVALT